MRALAPTLILLCACASVRDSNKYFVQVATYWQPQQASRVQADLVDHGYPAYIDETMDSYRSGRPQSMIIVADKGQTYPTIMRYKIRLGPYDNAADAERARAAMRTAGFRPYVVRH